MKIQGTTPQATFSHLLPTLLMGVFMSPLLAIGGSLVYQALENAKPQRATAIGALITAIAGALFIGLWFYILWKWGVWRPSVRITRFLLNGRNLQLHTNRLGEIHVAIEDVIKCRVDTGKQSGVLGWWIRLRKYGWVYMPKENSKGTELTEHLMQVLA